MAHLRRLARLHMTEVESHIAEAQRCLAVVRRAAKTQARLGYDNTPGMRLIATLEQTHVLLKGIRDNIGLELRVATEVLDLSRETRER
jgi:hypothetical protein